ncbi:TIGR04452 family lipoprotein [Leptospira sp. GIMC2001]|uniref:TIGR04452 family lipoprotein n=1 Tax=Leptospira sp. GIMC2001 TaxID=1513297 RepID=UPI002348F548|nr:TIGR04452 family lipoprotein [Leptospira sp. GIMC2001]WCL48879.1 TIGR04452 family lipoprotein [Leptospira sp. GIMC2001]
MKKILGFMLVMFIATNCILLDTINITYPWDGVIKGDAAKDQIFTSALIGAAAEIDGNNADDIIVILTDQLTGINDDRYYEKTDIDECANDALIINLVTADIGGYTCNARERKLIIDPII